MQIPCDCPLDLILKHWCLLTGKRTPLITEELLRLHTKSWPVQRLEGRRSWPCFGSLENGLITELLSELWPQRRWQEVRYAKLFAIFLNKSEAHKPEKNYFEMVIRGKRKEKRGVIFRKKDSTTI